VRQLIYSLHFDGLGKSKWVPPLHVVGHSKPLMERMRSVGMIEVPYLHVKCQCQSTSGTLMKRDSGLFYTWFALSGIESDIVQAFLESTYARPGGHFSSYASPLLQ
jgi:hypothetical protein